MDELDRAVDGVLGAATPNDNPFSLESIARRRVDEGDDPIGAAVDQVLDGERTRLRSTLVGAVRTNPEQAARANALARETGIPGEVVLRNLPEVEGRAAIERVERQLQGNPILERYMRERPEVAAIAHDDVEALAAVHGELKAWSGPKPTAGSVVSGLAQSMPQFFRSFSQSLSLQIGDAFEALGLLEPDPVFEREQLRRAAQAAGAGDHTRPDIQDPTLRAIYGGVESTLRAVPGIALSVATLSPIPAMAAAGVQAEADAYAKYRTRGASAGQAALGGVLEGSIEAGTELLPMGFLVDKFGKAGMREFMAGLLARELPSEQVATLLQDAVDTAVANPDKTWGEYLRERPGAAYQTLVSTLTQSALMGGASAAVTRLARGNAQAERAQEDAQRLGALVDTAASSKLRQRDAEAFREIVQAAAEESGEAPREVFIAADALAQSGVDLDALAQTMPGVSDQLAEAVAAGGDVAIPIGELAAAPELAQQLLPHLRVTPDAMSQSEAAAFSGEEAARLRSEIEGHVAADGAPQTASTDQALDLVRESIASQLQQAGRFTPDVNRQYAELMTSFFGATVERAGIPVQQLFEQFAPRIVSQLEPAPQAAGPAGVTADGAPAAADVLAQSQDTASRALYRPSSRTIALLERADLSSFIHESGHFFLDVQAELAAQGDAPAQIRDDMQRILSWFGVPDVATWRGMTLEQRRESHEKFARGFEAYTMEGKAPSLELEGAFKRFRAWLLSVYRHLTALKVELTPEVREVFGRMLATDAQIAAVEHARSFRALFSSAEQAGMTAEEWAAYQATSADATSEAVQSLQRRSLRDMSMLSNARSRALKALQRDAKAKRQAIEVEVRAEVEALPVYRADRLLRTGKLDGEHVGVKLSRPVLIAAYGDAADAPWRRLPDQYLTNNEDNGIAPDMLADLLGLTSGDQLIRQLTTIDPPEVAIEAETDWRMLQRHGELVDQQALERAADEAVHNDARLRALQREHVALAKAVGSRPVLARAAHKFAEQALGGRKVRSIRPAMHSAAAARAGRTAEDAFRKGDTAAAAEAKRGQMLQATMARAANSARVEVDAAIEYLRSFDKESTRKALDPDYRDQIDQLLERYDLRTSTTLREIKRRRSLAEWVEAQRELGFEPAIDASLLAEAQRESFRELTLEELRGLRDTVKNIEHLGRLKQRLLTVQDQRQFQAIVDEAAGSIRGNATRTVDTPIEETRWDAAKALFRQFGADHRKLASLARQMDGGKDGGPLWSVLIRGMNRAGDGEAAMRERATKALSELVRPLLKEGSLQRKLFIPEIGASLTKQARLTVALNWGNAANRQRIMDGDRWSSAQVQAVLSTLTHDDFAFVQGVWDYLDSYWPEIAAKEKRVSGVEPEKVQAEPFSVALSDGSSVELRGGYYPIKYDTRRSSKAEADSAAEIAKQMMQGLYTRATTRRGHTKARVDEVNRAVRKDLGVIFEHVEQVSHDLAWHEWLIDANRLLRAAPIDSAIRDHYGPEVLRTMRQALEDIAAGDVPAQTAFQKGLNRLRAGATIASMAWSFSTALMQPLGLTQSAVRIGPKWVAKGLGQWLGDAARLESTVAQIGAKSDFMRLRAQTFNREVAEVRSRVKGQSAAGAAIESSYFALMIRLQLVADIPTWQGQYLKAQAEGRDEATSIALADQAVRDAQGGGQISDLAAIQRGGPLMKIWTSFYSYFSTTYNLMAESVGRTSLRDPASIGRLAGDSFLLLVLPSVMGTLLKAVVTGAEDDEDKLAERLLRDQVGYLMGTMVGLRDLSGLATGFDYTGPAGTRFYDAFIRAAKQAAQGDVDAPLLKSANNAAGIVFHYPAVQINRTVEGFAAWRAGDASAAAILFGPPRP